MSSELERLLREGRNALPGPDPESTRRTRRLALLALRRGRRRFGRRAGALVAVVLAAAIALGVGAASLRSPVGEAAQGPVGLGFLPEPGWYVLQSGSQSSESRPAVALASNVPFAEEDDVLGLAESSGLPYETLLRLPPRGVVLVAVFLPQREPPSWLAGSWFTKTELPLRIGNAVPFIQQSAQVRPEAPLGQYQLRANVNGYDVDLTIYYGRQMPAPAQRAAAQRQLAQLVVRPARASRTAPSSNPTSRADTTRSAAVRFDRTVSCSTLPTGGVREVEVRARSGVKQGSAWSVLPDAIVATGQVTSSQNALRDALVWVTAGKPTSETMIGDEYYRTRVTSVGTLGVSTTLCRTVRTKVPLSAKGLRGNVASQLGEQLDCGTPQRVLVRVRATLASSSGFRRRDGFLRLSTPIVKGEIAVRTLSGKPLVYAAVADSGKTRLFIVRSCQPD